MRYLISFLIFAMPAVASAGSSIEESLEQMEAAQLKIAQAQARVVEGQVKNQKMRERILKLDAKDRDALLTAQANRLADILEELQNTSNGGQDGHPQRISAKATTEHRDAILKEAAAIIGVIPTSSNQVLSAKNRLITLGASLALSISATALGDHGDSLVTIFAGTAAALFSIWQLENLARSYTQQKKDYELPEWERFFERLSERGILLPDAKHLRMQQLVKRLVDAYPKKLRVKADEVELTVKRIGECEAALSQASARSDISEEDPQEEYEEESPETLRSHR